MDMDYIEMTISITPSGRTWARPVTQAILQMRDLTPEGLLKFFTAKAGSANNDTALDVLSYSIQHALKDNTPESWDKSGQDKLLTLDTPKGADAE